MTVAARPTTCGQTHAVTTGSGAWDIGVCRLSAVHAGEHDYQVEPAGPVTATIDGNPIYSDGSVDIGAVVCEGETVLLGCALCTYALLAHLGGRCPTEATAVAVWGRS